MQQDCGGETGCSAASSKCERPFIVSSTKEYFDMRIAGKKQYILNEVVNAMVLTCCEP